MNFHFVFGTFILTLVSKKIRGKVAQRQKENYIVESKPIGGVHFSVFKSKLRCMNL